jgi:hypothetical protein
VRNVFDRFEYLLVLAYADYRQREDNIWAPPGSFAWRQRRQREGSVFAVVEAEAKAAGAEWGFLQGRLFDGSLERFLEIKELYDKQVLPRRAW